MSPLPGVFGKRVVTVSIEAMYADGSTDEHVMTVGEHLTIDGVTISVDHRTVDISHSEQKILTTRTITWTEVEYVDDQMHRGIG